MVWNAKAAMKQKEINDGEPIDVLMGTLLEHQWPHESFFDTDNKLEALFLAHPRLVALALRFHHPATMDSTCKTNIFR